MTHPPFLGNFEEPWEQREPAKQYPGKRRLVEECHIIWVYALQRAVGKKALITAVREARPFRVPVPGGHYDVWLVYESHRLLGKRECFHCQIEPIMPLQSPQFAPGRDLTRPARGPLAG